MVFKKKEKKQEEEIKQEKGKEQTDKNKEYEDWKKKEDEKLKEEKSKKEYADWKKKELDKLAEANKNKETKMTRDTDSSEFLIYMHDTFGSGVRDLEPVKVNRTIQNGNVWLINEKLNFKEPQPENNNEYKNYLLEEIEKKINDLETERSSVLKKKIKDTKRSLKDLEQDLIFYRGYERSLKLQEEGSYLNISRLSDGRLPYYRFLRKGNFKLPLFMGVETGLIRVPNEFNIREAGDLLKENVEKNNPEKFLLIGRWIMLVLLIAAFLFLIYISYKSNSSVGVCSEAFKNISNAFINVADNGQLNTDLLTELVNNTIVKDSSVNIIPEVINR